MVVCSPTRNRRTGGIKIRPLTGTSPFGFPENHYAAVGGEFRRVRFGVRGETMFNRAPRPAGGVAHRRADGGRHLHHVRWRLAQYPPRQGSAAKLGAAPASLSDRCSTSSPILTLAPGESATRVCAVESQDIATQVITVSATYRWPLIRYESTFAAHFSLKHGTPGFFLVPDLQR